MLNKGFLRNWKYIFTFFIGVFVSIVLGFLLKAIFSLNEPFLYYSGYILQVFGISVLFVYLNKLNKDFDKKSKLNPLNLITSKEEKELRGSLSTSISLSGEIWASTKHNPKDDSIESHIEALRKDFDFEVKQLKSIIKERDKKIEKLTDQIESRIEDIKSENNSLSEKLASTLTGTNDWLYVGYLWTLIGILIILFA